MTQGPHCPHETWPCLGTTDRDEHLDPTGERSSNLAQTVFGGPPADASTVSTQDGQQLAVITARTGSYSPENLEIRAGVPTTLLVRSDDARGCVRSFVIPSRDIETVLPVKGDTRIDLGVLRPGSLRFACGMGMYTGKLTIVRTGVSTMATATHVFRVEGMHCGSCALLIDDTLEDLPGVHRTQTTTKTTTKTGHTTVELDPTQTSPDTVITAISELGYRATALTI